MKSFSPVVDEAIPHEAGHLLLGRVVRIPTRGLDVEVVRYENNMISVGNFATLTYEPPTRTFPGWSRRSGLHDVFAKGLMPVRLLPGASRAYFEPQVQDFEPRTMWSLHNAV
jgi:hypothetical protein